MKFDSLVNQILSEKFGSPTSKARRRTAIGPHMTSHDPNVWKDPLKRHSMKDSRPIDRKKPGWVPRTHQRELAIPMAERILNIAKDADEGIWRISKAQALALSAKYRMHVPNERTPAKRLGSTGIVMWRKAIPGEIPQMFLVKHDKLMRGSLAGRKKYGRMRTRPGKGRDIFKGSDKSRFKAKKPRKPLGPTFEPGKVGT